MSNQMIGLTTITSIAGAAFAIAGICFLVQHSQQNDHRISTQRYLDCPSPLQAPKTHDPAIALNHASYRQRLASIPEASTEDLFLRILPPRPRNSLHRDHAHSVKTTQQTFHAASSTPDRAPNAHTNNIVCQEALWELSDVQRHWEMRSPSLDIQSNQGHSEIGWTLDELNTLDGHMETEQNIGSVNVATHLPCVHISGIRSDHEGDYIHDWTQFTRAGFR